MAAAHFFRARLRFLAVLGASGALAPLACGGSTDSDGSGGSSGSGGQATGGTPAAGGTPATGGVTSTGGTPATGGTAGAPSCDIGNIQEQCYSLKYLENQLNNNGPWGGDAPAPDGGPDAGIVLTECPAYDLVRSDCCNPALSGPTKQADLCCYTFCENGCCGRAFVVDGQQRLAEVTTRYDWFDLPIGEHLALDPTTRTALTDAWREDARMEHASVASFARFTLELLALGAPPDLVADAQRAALDEVDHAKLCFAQASRFAQRALGPAQLDVGGATGSRSLPEVAAAALVEGAIGETLAAMLAREQLLGATDRPVQDALLRIAIDEENHAELAWRFVHWALTQGGEPVRQAIARAAAGALENPPTAVVPAGVDEKAWHQFGRLTESDANAVVQRATRDVIEPCLAVLLSEPKPQPESAPLEALQA